VGSSGEQWGVVGSGGEWWGVVVGDLHLLGDFHLAGTRESIWLDRLGSCGFKIHYEDAVQESSISAMGGITHFQEREFTVGSPLSWQLMKHYDTIEVETASGEKIQINQSPCLIGRAAEAHIRLPLRDVSRRHAILAVTEGVWWLMDMGSKSGTWLNGNRLNQAARIRSGDVLGLGSVRLKLQVAERPMPSNRFNSSLMDSTIPGQVEWLITSETLAVWIDEACRIQGGSPDAGGWLAAFFGDTGGSLPEPIRDWLSCHSSTRVPYESWIGDERLRISLCQMEGENRLLIMSRLLPAFTPDSARTLGLSKSEARVVPWLIRGRRNDEIAAILGIAPKTVEKHVARIMEKLKVETRTAAAWSIIERSGAHR